MTATMAKTRDMSVPPSTIPDRICVQTSQATASGRTSQWGLPHIVQGFVLFVRNDLMRSRSSGDIGIADAVPDTYSGINDHHVAAGQHSFSSQTDPLPALVLRAVLVHAKLGPCSSSVSTNASLENWKKRCAWAPCGPEIACPRCAGCPSASG